MRPQYHGWRVALLGTRRQSCATCSVTLFAGRVAVRRRSRFYSIASKSRGDGVEEHVVQVGSSGRVTIDLHNPSSLTQPTTPLIIYLPPFPAHVKTPSQPSLPPFLASTTLPIARINYRWNYKPPPSKPSPSQSLSPSKFPSSPFPPAHAFPIPLHDVLLAFTYLTRTFRPPISPPSTPPSPTWSFEKPQPPRYVSPSPRPILIYGTHLSASLATSLALTETFASKHAPFEIKGLISYNGIYDWTGLATSYPPTTTSPSLSSSTSQSTPSQPTKETKPLDTTNPKTYLWSPLTELELELHLHRLKTHLFTSPQSSFDAFASPILFFRTAGLSVPKEWITSDSQSPSPSPRTSPTAAQIQGPQSPNSTPKVEASDRALSPSPSLAEDLPAEDDAQHHVAESIIPTRRSHLRFPPRDSGLKIPRSLFLYSQAADVEERESLLQSQAEEMAGLMRRSVLMHEFKERKLWDEEFAAGEESEGRVRVEGVDDGGGDAEETVERWIEDVLCL